MLLLTENGRTRQVQIVETRSAAALWVACYACCAWMPAMWWWWPIDRADCCMTLLQDGAVCSAKPQLVVRGINLPAIAASTSN